MNIAYLILAHNQPQQLERLINRLDVANTWFYVHIDQKSPDKQEITRKLEGKRNVKVISEYDVNWMGFNMVRATLALMHIALNSGIDLKYLVLMSGQDYPIKGNRQINDFFSYHNEDFISFASINDSAENYKNKVRHFHYYDFAYSNPRNKKKIPLLVYLYYGIHKHVMRRMPKRKFYKDMEPFFGSQWFAITAQTGRYILDFIAQNKGYMRFMQYTEGPDETFFHTIILNSPQKTNVYDYKKFEQWRKTREGEYFIQDFSSLRYMDWSDRGKNAPKPAVLDENYFEVLAQSSDLFARKVDEKISGELMNRIDKELLDGK